MGACVRVFTAGDCINLWRKRSLIRSRGNSAGDRVLIAVNPECTESMMSVVHSRRVRILVRRWLRPLEVLKRCDKMQYGTTCRVCCRLLFPPDARSKSRHHSAHQTSKAYSRAGVCTMTEIESRRVTDRGADEVEPQGLAPALAE